MFVEENWWNQSRIVIYECYIIWQMIRDGIKKSKDMFSQNSSDFINIFLTIIYCIYLDSFLQKYSYFIFFVCQFIFFHFLTILLVPGSAINLRRKRATTSPNMFGWVGQSNYVSQCMGQWPFFFFSRYSRQHMHLIF